MTGIISCESEKDINLGIGTKSHKGKLKSYIQNKTVSSKTIKTAFEYNDNDQLEIIRITNTENGVNSEELFIYEESGKIKSSKYTLLKATGNEIFDRAYKYTGELVTQITETKQGSTNANYFLFEYSSQNQLTNYTLRSLVGNTNKFLGNGTLTWSNGNMILLNETFSSGLIEETDFQYEDTINPLYEINSKYLKFPFLQKEYFNPKNIKAYRMLFDGGKIKYESSFNEENKLSSQKAYRFEGTEWVKTSENIFEYYN